MTRIVVVGAGITGLTAAYTLTKDDCDVTVLEASERIGGKILTSPFAGAPAVEEGGDVFLARVPWAKDLCAELGLTDDLISPSAASASVYWNGRLHPIPDGLVLGVPAGLAGLARSGLLSPRGKLRAAIEPFVPRRDHHDNVGRLVRQRFGAEVLERLVDPLVGGINAGDADQLSLQAAVPQLQAAADTHCSLLLGLRANRPTTSGPVFLAPRQGMSALPHALAARLHDVRLSCPVRSLTRSGSRWTVVTDAEEIEADGVILAVPAFAAAALLADISPTAARELGGIPYASVAMVTLAFASSSFPDALVGAGYLVPKPQQRSVTAVSYGTAKWPAWRVGGQVLLRVSLGRFGNDAAAAGTDVELIARALADTRPALHLTAEPTTARVSRWDRAFPQYLPRHPHRVAAMRSALTADGPGIVLAGAAYEGIGIPACIRQGIQAAGTIRQSTDTE
jgi:protoporphyrinogen/coproporphyrinogen III oxidase